MGIVEEGRKGKVVFLEDINLCEVFDDTQAVRGGVFVCFFNNYPYDYAFRPRVEVTEVNNLQHALSYLEIRILDGDLFYIFTGDSKLINELKCAFSEYVLD